MRQPVDVQALKKFVSGASGGSLCTTDLALDRYCRNAVFLFSGTNDAGTAPTLDVKLQHSDRPTASYAYSAVGAVDIPLNHGSADNVALAAKFTQSGAHSIKSAKLMLKKIGTLAAGKLLTLKIVTDSSGPTTTVLGTSNTVDIDTKVGTAYAWVEFTFPTPVDLADSTVYYFQLTGDYDVSPTNQVDWRTKALGSGGNSYVKDTIWAAVATNSHEILAYELTFTDITSGAFAQVAGALAMGEGSLEFPMALLKFHVRGYATIGGTSTPAFYAGIGAMLEQVAPVS